MTQMRVRSSHKCAREAHAARHPPYPPRHVAAGWLLHSSPLAMMADWGMAMPVTLSTHLPLPTSVQETVRVTSLPGKPVIAFLMQKL